MRKQDIAIPLLMGTLALLLATIPMWAHAQQQPGAKEQPGNEQVIIPQVDRREVKLPRMPSKDFEVGAFAGVYATQNFGTHAVGGIRLGYHLSEDIFVEGVLAQTKVSDEPLRAVIPAGIFPEPTEKLTYYNLSAGYNVLPGEVFIGSKRAKATAVYLIGGVGSTKLFDQRKLTFNFGLGMRLLLADRWAVQVDMRDHVFTHDLLGKKETTNNPELTTGITYYF